MQAFRERVAGARVVMVKVAAYQAELSLCEAADAVAVIRKQVDWCESTAVEILCCPEAILGGLADYVDRPTSIAVSIEGGHLDELLSPLASETVTTIVGFTEIDRRGRLYNAAAIYQRGAVVGVYRKLHPAINKSVYTPGHEMPVFTVGGLTFGIVICRDSTHPEAARVMVSRGAAALFVPTNNGLPPTKGGPALVADARRCDVARARENQISVIRADVAGSTRDLVSHGSSEIVSPDGTVLACARQLGSDLIVAEIETTRRLERSP